MNIIDEMVTDMVTKLMSDLEVIAEGVESSDQLSELYSWGCDYAQGFLYSPAIHSGKIENYLNNLPRSINAR